MLDLEEALEAAEGRVAELEQALREARRAPEGQADLRAHVPHVTSISVDSLSHAKDNDGDGRPDEIVLYVTPADGLGRFVQLAGTLTAHAAILPGDADAITIGRVALDPAAVRAAYKASFMGTHYTVRVPLDATGAGAAECIARVEYTDGRDGGVHAAEATIPLE